MNDYNYRTSKKYTNIYDTSAACSISNVKYSWLLLRIKNGVFNPYNTGSGFVWTPDGLRAIKRRKRHEDFGFIKGAKVI